MRIFLVGYMASGKTTIAPMLSERLSMPWYDLDAEIAAEAGHSVAEIFRIHGEPHFRKLEQSALKRLTAAHPHMILATGGGTACEPGAMEWMNENGTTVYLEVTPGVVVQRLGKEPFVRPLVAGIQADHLHVFITGHMHSRMPFYHLSKVKIDGTVSLEAQLDEIERHLGNIAP